MSPPQSALVVLVPEAEAVVGPFRERFDPAAAAGVPAHVTLLYPFKPPDTIGPEDLADLRRCFAGFAPFRFALTAPRRFPDVLYLPPEPDAPFRRLTLAIWARSADTPPYGGQHDRIIPHLTVAHVADGPLLDRVEADFEQAARGQLPIRATATAVTLLDNRTGRWRVQATLALGAGASTVG